MKVKDLLKMEIDIDVVDDVCEELWIAFCGAMDLTEEAQEKFAEVLEYEVTFSGSGNDMIAIIHIDDPNDDVWESRLEKAQELFWALAGYCDADDYDRWFTYHNSAWGK